MDDITIKQMTYFITAAECQNFTEAAQKLYVSQPAISKWIGRLEASLGIKLFKRNKYGVALTESGQILYYEWKHLLEIYYESLKKAGVSMNADNNLIVGCLPHLKNDPILNRAIIKFENANPDVPVMIELYEFKDLREHLISGTLDLAICYNFDFEKVAGISQKILSKAEMYIALSKSHHLAKQAHLTLIDFKDEVFYLVSMAETKTGSSKVFETCQRAGFTPKNVKYVSNFSSLELLLEQGKGVAICGKHVSKEFEDSIHLIPIENDLTDNYISLAWKTENASPLTLQFLEMA